MAVAATPETVGDGRADWGQPWDRDAASLAVLAVWGDQVGCHLHVAREGYSVPDLTEHTLEEARALVRSCIEIEPTIATHPSPSFRIVDQVPEPPAVLNSDRAIIQVTLAPGS